MSKQISQENKRKVFICFLGTNNYALCNYYFNGNINDKIENVRFIQEAIVAHECAGWTENDRIFIFLTKDAQDANWSDGLAGPYDSDKQAEKLPESQWGKIGSPKWGLETQLKKLADEKKLFPKQIITPISDVDDSSSEDAIWNLFNLIDSKIEHNDEVYFDFTSGFRNLSMLGMVLLTYLKNTKNITIGEIYYGAFERLGRLNEVKDKIPVPDRNAPVLKLKEFNNIMDFSNAANAFVKYGNGMQLHELLDSWRSELGKSGKRDNVYNNIYQLGSYINNLTLSLQTCRGREIVNAIDLKKIFKVLSSVETEGECLKNEYKALRPIFNLIKEKFKPFDGNESINNGFIASEWCYKNGMYQQSMTLLQETLVSYCAEIAGLDYSVEDQRSVVEYYLGRSKEGDHDENEWKTKKLKDIGFEDCSKIEESMCKIDKDLPFKGHPLSKISELSIFYDQLTQLRNDLNHGGFLEKKNTFNKNGKLNSIPNARAIDGTSVENECKNKIDKFKELKSKLPELDEKNIFNEIFRDDLSAHWSEKDQTRIEADLRTALQYLNSAYSKILQLKKVDEGKAKLTRNTEDIIDEAKSQLSNFNSLKGKIVS